MRSGVLCLVVAHLFAILTVSYVAAAEKAKPKVVATSPSKSEEVGSKDLALGQPAPVPAPARPQAPAPASAASPAQAPTTVTTAHVAPPQTVASPILASAAVISNGAQTTAVVDIRLLPKQLPYRGERAIDGYVLEERRRWWLIVAGGALFSIGYAAAIVTGNQHDFDNGLGFSAIPIAGPWVSMAVHKEQDCNELVDLDCEEDDVKAPLFVAGLMQTAGAVLLPIGILSIKQVWLRKDLAVGLLPSRVGRSGYGAVLGGTF